MSTPTEAATPEPATQSATVALAQNVAGVEILRVGTWNGHRFTREALTAMVDAFTKIGFVPPVKLGHDEDPKAPAFGWVDRLWTEGDVLKADFRDVPDELVEQIKAKRYDTVSVEAWANLSRNGKTYPTVLKAVAILGAHPPGVSHLKPLSSAMGFAEAQGAEVFTTYPEERRPMVEQSANPQDKQMPAPEPKVVTPEPAITLELAELRKRMASMEDAGLKIQKLQEEVTAAHAQLDETRREKVRGEIEATVSLLKIPAVRPHVRALMTMAAESKGEDGRPRVIKFQAVGDDAERDTTALGIVRDLIDRLNVNATFMFGEAAHGIDGSRDDEDLSQVDPSMKVLQLAKVLAAKNGISLGEATQAVLTDPANRKLAAAYRVN